MKVDLGPAESFTSFPAPVEIEAGFYYLVRAGGGYRLLSTICPHAGGEVVWREEEDAFVCSVHGWRFDPAGEMGAGTPGLRSRKVRQRKGRLWVEL